MSDARARKTASRDRRLGLMATASLVTLLAAGQAQAQCVATPGNPPLSNLPADTLVQCNGSTTGAAIFANGVNVGIAVNPGATLANGSVTFNAAAGTFDATDATINNVAFSTSGPQTGTSVRFNGVSGSDNSFQVEGDQALLSFENSTSILSQPGTILLIGGTNSVGPGGNGTLSVINSSITGNGVGNGAYLLATGAGHESVNLFNVTLTTNSDGLLLDTGDGDDFITIAGTTTLVGGAAGLFIDGGAGADRIDWFGSGSGTHSYDVNVQNIENARFNAGTGGLLIMSGTATYDTVRIGAGTVRIDNIQALGSNTAAVTINTGGTLQLNHSFNPTLNQSFSGGGVLHQTTGVVTYSGNSAGFTGRFINDSFATLTNANAMGSAAITNNFALNFGDFTLANDIDGAGVVRKFGTGVGTLSGNNSFTGGVQILGGGLTALGVNALGTGAVTGNAGTVLTVVTSGNQTLTNTLTGQLALVKDGAGILTLTGANDYSGGTTINFGGIRVDDFARLGSGPVVANANGSLILNYNGAGQLLQTTTFLTGAGRFVKEGSGTIVVDVASTYTGGTIIEAGRIGLNNGQGLGSGDILLFQGAELALGGVTVANNISGAGRVIKTASNNGFLTGVNTYTGGTDIQDGTLTVFNPVSLGSGGVSIGAGATLAVDYSGSANVALSNQLTGLGALVKSGSGTLVINNSNTFSGGTTISAGQINLNFGDGLGVGGVTIAGGAALGIGSVTVANSVSGAGVILKLGSGSGVLTGVNTHSGGTMVVGGNLTVAGDAQLGSGGVSVASGATLTVGGNANATLNSVLTGAGGLIKAGAGDLTVANNGLTGGVSIVEGRLLASAGATHLGSGPVAVSSGAELVYTVGSDTTFAHALSGAGTFRKLGSGRLDFMNPFTVGNLVVDAGHVRLNTTGTANVTVGTSGSLDGLGTIVGNLTNNGLVAPGNSIGTLVVQGNYVQNAGSVLEIEFDAAGNIDLLDISGSASLNGGTLRFISVGGAEGTGGTFMRTGGALTGAFATVETVGAQIPLAVIYQPNAGIMAPSVLSARPSTFNAQALAAADTTLGFIGTLGVADSRRPEGNRMWSDGFSAWGSRSESGTTLAYDHDSQGVAGGFDLVAGERLTVGLAVGLAEGDIELGSSGGGGEQSSLLGALHARYRTDSFTLGGGIAYGRVDQDTLRNVSFSGITASIPGSTESSVLAVFGGVEAPLYSAGGWDFAANARASYVRQSQDGYSEEGSSPLRLTLDEIETDTIEGEAMLSARTWLWSGEEMAEDARNGVALNLDLGVRYLGLQGDRIIPVTFSGSNAGVELQGDGRDGLHTVAGAALSYTSVSGVVTSFGYRAEVGETDRHSLHLGVNFRF